MGKQSKHVCETQGWVQVQATVLKSKSKYGDIFQVQVQVQVQPFCYLLKSKSKYMSLYLSTSTSTLYDTKLLLSQSRKFQ